MMKINSKHVNLSLETAFVFDPKDSYYDISLIKTLRDFLDSLQDAITNKTRMRSRPKESKYAFSDFLYELGGYFVNYSDDDFKTTTVALQNVVEDYYPSGTVYHRIVFDPRLKAFIKNSLTQWADTDPKILKSALKSMYDRPTYNETFVKFVQVLNTFFDKTDVPKLQKYAKKFEKFPSTQKRLESNIDKTLNFIVFERYDKLNYTMRGVLIEELSKVAEYVAVAFYNRSVDPEFLIRKRTFENVTFQDLLRRDHEQDMLSHSIWNSEGFSGSERENFPISPNDSLEKKTKASDDEKRSKNEIEREIVLNKVIDVNVRNDLEKFDDFRYDVDRIADTIIPHDSDKNYNEISEKED